MIFVLFCSFCFFDRLDEFLTWCVVTALEERTSALRWRVFSLNFSTFLVTCSWSYIFWDLQSCYSDFWFFNINFPWNQHFHFIPTISTAFSCWINIQQPSAFLWSPLLHYVARLRIWLLYDQSLTLLKSELKPFFFFFCRFNTVRKSKLTKRIYPQLIRNSYHMWFIMVCHHNRGM